jgi:type I site-specific restriction endonuclease
LPFCYESTGVETRFTNLLDPDARSRPVFGFHRPESPAAWMEADLKSPGSGLRNQLRLMPGVPRDGLWDHQHHVIANLEQSLARNHPRALIHMTMGSGKTFTACNFVYRLIAYAGARRVLFLVDRRTLGRQALNEFQQFTIPGDGRKFTEIYNVQLLSSNTIDPVCRVAITFTDGVADGVSVDFDVYKIDTRITAAGSRVESGFWTDKRDRLTRARRAELLDIDFSYTSQQLNRDVVAPDHIRIVIREFRDKLFSDIFPGRTEVPKTLVFARDDSHADDIVQIVREEFGKGNEFCLVAS